MSWRSGRWDNLPTASDAGLNALISKLRKVRTGDLRPGSAAAFSATTSGSTSRSPNRRCIEPRRGSSTRTGQVRGRPWLRFIADREFLPGEEALRDRGGTRPAVGHPAPRHSRPMPRPLSALVTRLPAAGARRRRLVSLVPLRESGHQLLMRALAGQGNQAEALSVHAAGGAASCAPALGASPDKATQAVHQTLLHTVESARSGPFRGGAQQGLGHRRCA